jgi:hypothetical protein
MLRGFTCDAKALEKKARPEGFEPPTYGFVEIKMGLCKCLKIPQKDLKNKGLRFFLFR